MIVREAAQSATGDSGSWLLLNMRLEVSQFAASRRQFV
jgi:hypothetical protein